MSKAPTSGIGRLILRQLSHPLKLRLALCAAMVITWQVFFFGPLGEDVAATMARIARERQRTATARQIEQLKKGLAPEQDAVGSADGVHELIRFVIARIRSSPLRLVDLVPGKARDLGPFQAISLQLKLGGTYSDIDDLLGWVESNPRLLRVDNLLLKPNPREPGRLDADIALVALAEKAPPTPARAEPRAPTKAAAKPVTKAPTRPVPKAPTKTPPKAPTKPGNPS